MAWIGIGLAAWIVLSVPLALVVGAALRTAQRTAPRRAARPASFERRGAACRAVRFAADPAA